MEIKTYNGNAKEVFEIFQAECLYFLKNAGTCNMNNELCTLNNCSTFNSRYLDFTPICRIPGRQCCTVATNGKDWKHGDCCTCKIAEKFENPE